MYSIEMLPADYGDSLFIEYGTRRRTHRILIDAGTKNAYPRIRARLEQLPRDERRFELLVITHVDFDHIGGILPLLEEAEALGVSFDEIWFNGYAHLHGDSIAADLLGSKHGEALTKLIDAGGPDRWNKTVDGAPIVVPAAGALPVVTLSGGMKLTLLTPSPERLLALIPAWVAECRRAGLVPGERGLELDEDVDEDILGLDVELLAEAPFREDTAAANGTSIAFVAEYDGQRALFTGDAFPSDVLAALNRTRDSTDTPCDFDAVKLSHHASKGSTSPELLTAIRAPKWLVSTNGARFRHPSPETIARLLSSGQGAMEICFNYETEHNRDWRQARLTRRYGYSARYGSDERGIAIHL